MIKASLKIYKYSKLLSLNRFSNAADTDFFVNLAKHKIMTTSKKEEEINFAKFMNRVNENNLSSVNVENSVDDIVSNDYTENSCENVQSQTFSVAETQLNVSDISVHAPDVEPSQRMIDSMKDIIGAIPLDEINNSPNEILNVGPLISNNETMKKFLNMGVDLFQYENAKGGANILLRLHWEKDVMPVISFIENHAEFGRAQLARLISYNPQIFRRPLTEMKEVFEYFQERNIDPADIARIVSDRPIILQMNRSDIVKNVSGLETMIGFSTVQMNSIIVALPKIVDQKLIKSKSVLVQLHRMLRFTKEETKEIILNSPILFIKDKDVIGTNCIFLNRVLNIPYEDIVKCAPALAVTPSMLEQRVKYLLFLNRYQTDPTKELYTPINRIIDGTIHDFCNNVAHTSVGDFSRYLKSM